jgi:hypothetical protein
MTKFVWRNELGLFIEPSFYLMMEAEFSLRNIVLNL